MKVFIVWGGNKELADRVSEKIQDHNEFNVQVGGEDPNALFIGTTVLQQIQMSSIAIILVQNSDKTGVTIQSPAQKHKVYRKQQAKQP